MGDPASIAFRPIGIIRTQLTSIEGMPIQAVAGMGLPGRIEVEPSYAVGLDDIDGFSHLILIYHLHRSSAARLTVTPFLDDRRHGIFATRSPARPNAIGLSTVRLRSVEGTTLHIEDIDILDGTPLLDIKPYVPAFDDRPGARIGWFDGRLDELRAARADARFVTDT